MYSPRMLAMLTRSLRREGMRKISSRAHMYTATTRRPWIAGLLTTGIIIGSYVSVGNELYVPQHPTRCRPVTHFPDP